MKRKHGMWEPIADRTARIKKQMLIIVRNNGHCAHNDFYCEQDGCPNYKKDFGCSTEGAYREAITWLYDREHKEEVMEILLDANASK